MQIADKGQERSGVTKVRRLSSQSGYSGCRSGAGAERRHVCRPGEELMCYHAEDAPTGCCVCSDLSGWGASCVSPARPRLWLCCTVTHSGCRHRVGGLPLSLHHAALPGLHPLLHEELQEGVRSSLRLQTHTALQALSSTQEADTRAFCSPFSAPCMASRPSAPHRAWTQRQCR